MTLFKEKNKNKSVHDEQTVKAVLSESNKTEIKRPKQKRSKILSSFAEIAPVTDIVEFDFFEMRDGEYMEIVQVTSKDIYSLNDNDLHHDIDRLAYLLQAYTPDFKLFPLNIPVSLEKQKDNILKRIQNCKKEEYKPFLKKKLLELEVIEKHKTNREYFVFLYADSVTSLLERKAQFQRHLSRSNPIEDLTLEKKVNVLYQLANINTKPI